MCLCSSHMSSGPHRALLCISYIYFRRECCLLTSNAKVCWIIVIMGSLVHVIIRYLMFSHLVCTRVQLQAWSYFSNVEHLPKEEDTVLP